MNAWEYLALALELWTAIGLIGLAISVARRERQKLWQGAGSLVGVWLVYLAVLAVVSYRDPEQRVPMGQSVCFHKLCYTLQQVEEMPGFPVRKHERLLRLTIAVTNRGKTEAQEDLIGYLLDGRSRIWPISSGVSGNQLSARVLAGQTIISVPVFRVAPDATGFELALRHSRWSRSLHHALVIGDPESLGHRQRLMMLDR